MNKIKSTMAVVTALIMLTAAVGCQPNETEQGSTVIADSGSVSAESTPPAQSTPSSTSSTPANSETAEFCLGDNAAAAQGMTIGDKLGEWALQKLEISRNADQAISMLEAVWQGEVTLNGVITRNGLVEHGYDFTVSAQDYAKMPVYVSPLMSPDKRQDMFMLTIPDGLANAPSLEFGEELLCNITVSDYSFIFAYMTAPAGATVTKIEPLDSINQKSGATNFAVDLTTLAGESQSRTMGVSLLLPEASDDTPITATAWLADGNQMLADGNVVAEVKAVYGADGFDWNALGAIYPSADPVGEVEIGSVGGKYYFVTQDVNTGGMTVKQHNLHYYVDNGEWVVYLQFNPMLGTGGISKQREVFEDCLATMQVR